MDLPKVILKFIGDTFQVAALKRIKPSIRKTIKEMQSLMKLTKVLLTFYNSFSTISSTIREEKCFKGIAQSAYKFSVRPSQGSCFKVL